MMEAALTKIVLLFSVLSIVCPYSIEATWKLRTSEIGVLKSLTSPIYFDFRKQVSPDGESTIGHLTITACNIMMYSYEVNDSQIYLTFLSVGRATRNCLKGEIAFLRAQLDETFFFYIMHSTLLLLPPNSDLPIKCDIHSTAITPPINGIWTITDGLFFAKISDPNVVINGSRIGFCQGNQAFAYKPYNIVKINVTTLQSNEICNREMLQIFWNATRFYRVNSLANPQTCTFFDENSGLILQLTYQGDFLMNKAIPISSLSLDLPSNSSTTNSQASANSSSSNKTLSTNSSKSAQTAQINTTSKSSNSTSNATINSTIINNNSSQATLPNQLNTTTNKAQSLPAISNTSTSNATSLPKNNSNSTTTLSANKTSTISSSAPNNSTTAIPSKPNVAIYSSSSQPTNSAPNTTITTKTNATTSSNTGTTASPAQPTFAVVSQASSIFGVWYPSTSVLPNQMTATDISAYQLLMNGAFLMLRGGCNTIISPYTFSGGVFTPTKLSVTGNACPVNKDSILQAIIFNSTNFYQISGGSTNPMIRIASVNNNTLLLLTPIAPS